MRSQFGSSLYIVLRLEGAEVDLAVEAVKMEWTTSYLQIWIVSLAGTR